MTTAATTSLPVVAPLTPALLRSLLAASGEPCVSIYLPTHRATPPDDLNRIVLKGLVADAAKAVASWRGPDGQEPIAADRLLAPLVDLMASPLLQAPAHDGLAAFMADGTWQLVAVDGPVEPEAAVAPRFHLLPLARRLAAIEHCLVIAITERLVRVGVGEITAPGNDRFIPLPLPRGDHAAAGELFRDEIVEETPRQPHRVLHGGGPFGGARVHGGYGSRTDGIDTDTTHFLREAARTVAQASGWDAGWPIVTVGLPQLSTHFATLAVDLPTKPLRVDRNPERLSAAELAACAGEVVRAGRQHRRARLLDAFRTARAHGRGSGDLAEIARAAVAGQVATLLVEAGRREAGVIDRGTGRLVSNAGPATHRPAATARAAGGEDLFEDLVEIVLAHGGGIVSLEHVQMPTETGVAAIYRY